MVGVAVTLVSGSLVSKTVREIVGDVVGWLWQLLVCSYSVPGWVLAIGLFAVGLVLFWVIGAVRTQPTAQPPWQSFTGDEIFGVPWRWSWAQGGRIRDLCAYCPTCDDELRDESTYPHDTVYMICEHCSRQRGRTKVVTSIEVGHNHLVDLVRKEIRRRLRTGERSPAPN